MVLVVAQLAQASDSPVYSDPLAYFILRNFLIPHLFGTSEYMASVMVNVCVRDALCFGFNAKEETNITLFKMKGNRAIFVVRKRTGCSQAMCYKQVVK